MLHVSCMAGPGNTTIMRTSKAQRLPHKRAACVPKCCTCHTITIGFFFYPVCNSDCCHDILHPLSYCQPMSWAYEKVVLAEIVTMSFVSVREDFLYQHSTTSSLLFKKNSHSTWQASNVRSPLQPPLQTCNWKGLNAPNLNGCFF